MSIDLIEMTNAINDALLTHTGVAWNVTAEIDRQNDCIVVIARYKDGNWRNGHPARKVNLYLDKDMRDPLIQFVEALSRDWQVGRLQGVYHA